MEEKILYTLDIEPKHKVVFDMLMAHTDVYRARNFVAEIISYSLSHLHSENDNSYAILRELANDALTLTGFDVVNNNIDYKTNALSVMTTMLADIVNTWAVHLLLWNVPVGIVDVASLTNAYINFIVTKDE